MANQFERIKSEKDGLAVKAELEQFARLGWENIPEDDRDHRLKWLGIFSRKRTPGQFMLRLRVPNGILTSGQMRMLGAIIHPYGVDGVADITTRQNLQLRGIPIEEMPQILGYLKDVGLTSVQSGMDNVRNITGSPLAGIDPDELIDVRGLTRKVQDMITNNGEGNESFSNLPRKFNIAIAGCRDNSVHAEINDLAFIPAFKNGKLGFNVLVGGFFSARRCAEAISLNVWADPRDVVAICEAVLLVYRDHGLRANRQKSRLMWLVDEWGIEKFRATLESQIGHTLPTAAEKDEVLWHKRDLIGVHAQKQPGLNFVGLHVPVGRLQALELMELARMAEVYGSGELRLTVEQNLLIPNVPDSRVASLLKEPLLKKFSPNPGPLQRGLVSCTGNQFCNFALIETKNQAVALMEVLEQELELPRIVRIHWTGCPNSCGQPQVADIGLMGTTARKDGKPVEAVDIYMGGEVGKDAKLGECVRKGIPCEDLKPVLVELLIEHFGAKLRLHPPVAGSFPHPVAIG
ncbi:ferredoxin--nitrite reductase [Synechococcus sp. Nb3U1]|uniref:ferredoxin--nitrite reductase n=1 Tax=Synechococcus sp. Nb3U1 TaxID=1914529 RepID=UPI001F33B458|nr:ferredoxin--nitrite reductase [Synechococcus sp. Nb3U1]MCF2971857.1 ferredoxin--nitrite reductase [Synechococcus sp. Nb3U1]